MPAVQYPFIDIAVHERVKDHFARGEAIVLFSLDLQDVLFANGAGSALFGHALIYDLIEDGPNRNDVTFRQVESTARQLSATGESRSFLIRIPSGFQRVPVQAVVERIRLHGDVEALLFAAPVSNSPLKADEIARAMLKGFDDPDTHMAVLGADGAVLAASAGFGAIKLAPQTARTLVAMVSGSAERLVKRPVPTGKGYLPAAIGTVSDSPAMHLLFAVETILGNMGPANDFPETADEPPVATPEAAPLPVADTAPSAEPHPLVEVAIEESSEEVEETILPPGLGPEEPVDEAPVAEADIPGEPVHLATEQTSPLPDRIADAEPVSDTDAKAEAPAEAADDTDGFRFDRQARPTRFVWKIDADGNFSEVSPELAAAVGPHAASLTGTAFADIANLLELDPEGKLEELLGRRDTWSGKTIYWPIEGTTLKAPVDLAALPTYKRNREFDGFRGFGIVRLSDAIEDESRIGLTLAAGGTAPPEETAPEAPLEAFHFSADDEDAEPEAAETVSPEVTETREEPPVLRFADPLPRPEGEKIINLDDRRSRARDGLTPGEQEAFREIARQLEPFRREQEEEEAVSATASEPDGAMEGETAASLTQTAEPEASVADDQARTEEPDAEAAGSEPALETVPEAEPVEQTPSASETEQLEMLASLIPSRTARDHGLTANVIDEVPVAILIHTGDRLIHANPEFLKISGYADLAALDAVGGLDSLLHHKDLEGMPDQSGGLSMVRADDQLVPVTARLQSVRWEDGTALLLALIPSGHKPASTEKGIEPQGLADEEETRLNARVEALTVEVEELRSILETATDGVVIIGPEGTIRSMNRSASALFDYDETETRGKPFVMLFAHESHRAVADYLAGMTGHGVASVLNDGREVIGREASGGFIPLFMTIGKLSASNGFCAVIRDITQWKRSEEELKSAKRAAETANAHKSDFLARVSHEIRTPLNAIIGFSDMMAIEHFGPIGHPRYVEYANDIARSGRLVLDIVNDLLDISKIEAGEMELEFAAVGLNDAVSEAVSLVQPQAHNQRVIIRTAFSDAVPDVVADLRSIKQIVLNILANSIRFTPAGGQIVVSTAYETNGSVVLRIRDTGIGMTRAELEQAMKPFRQVTGGGKARRGDGTGLGLPLTKAMVDANRANFTIQSTPNEGTLVEITFPSPRVLAN